MKKIVKNKKTVRIVSTLLALITLLTCFPLMTSCSRPPELAEVKDELIALLEGSYVINDILFGAGLTTEYDETGLYDEYTEEIQNFESYYSDDQIFHYFYSPVVATTKDGTKQYTSINEIKEAALKIYSEDYLRKVFVQAFEGETVTVNGIVFVYSEKGIPSDLCSAEKLIYVTTSGGPIMKNFGYEYTCALARSFYGIADLSCVSAEGLDIRGADAEAILQKAIEGIKGWKSQK